jgi:predicted amidophosphoribosyltransferase
MHADMICKECGNVMSAVTLTCNRCSSSIARFFAEEIQMWGERWGVAFLQSLDPKNEHDQHLANAALIAKAPIAPKLAEALRAVAEDGIAMRGFHEQFRAQIRAALAEWDNGGQS